MTIVAGDRVTWVNKSGAAHTVTRCTPATCNGASGGTGTDPSFTSGDVGAASGASFTQTFSRPGTYVYYCKLHGYALMHGTITVTAAIATTPTAPATTAPATTVLAAPTTAPSPRLASTGGRTQNTVALALILIVIGLTATSIQLGRRHS
jgi:copper binding plastocyanin/azurin family protein